MVQVRVQRSLLAGEHAAVDTFLADAYSNGATALSDHLAVDLAQGQRDGFTAALASDDSGALVGYAQASAANDGALVGIVSLHADLRARLLAAVLAELPADTGVTWWSHDPADGEVAGGLGLHADRCLLQMRMPLPVAADTDVALRPFRVGADETAWLEVNNAAFAWHGEQGGWDVHTLEQREREDWFDPAGFLLHERDGRLAAFCWTKLHREHGTVVGEIYVIAVHPDFHGHGLGWALTVAGLRHLHSVGATEAMLYVDADNAAAVHLYERLGFIVARTEQSYLRASASDRLPPEGAHR